MYVTEITFEANLLYLIFTVKSNKTISLSKVIYVTGKTLLCCALLTTMHEQL